MGNGRKGDNRDPAFFSLRDQKTGGTLNWQAVHNFSVKTSVWVMLSLRGPFSRRVHYVTGNVALDMQMWTLGLWKYRGQRKWRQYRTCQPLSPEIYSIFSVYGQRITTEFLKMYLDCLNGKMRIFIHFAYRFLKKISLAWQRIFNLLLLVLLKLIIFIFSYCLFRHFAPYHTFSVALLLYFLLC